MAVADGVAVALAVGVSVAVAVAVGTGVAVAAAVCVGAGVLVALGLAVCVDVGILVDVAMLARVASATLGTGVAVRIDSPPRAQPAKISDSTQIRTRITYRIDMEADYSANHTSCTPIGH